MPADPVYALTKHAVVGFVRSMGRVLADRGVSINAVCPGGVDTAIVPPDLRSQRGEDAFMDPALIASAVITALTSGGSGEIWVVSSAEHEPWRYEFAGLSPS